MQSTGHTSMQSPHMVQLHVSIEYSAPLLITAFSGQTILQLSQAMQIEEISSII